MLRLINQLVSQAIRTWSLVEGIHQAPVHFPMLYQALFIEHDPNWSRRTFSIHVNFCTLPSSSFSEYHSFIHYGDLYSAPSRLLLRSAPDPCTTKKKSFETLPATMD